MVISLKVGKGCTLSGGGEGGGLGGDEGGGGVGGGDGGVPGGGGGGEGGGGGGGEGFGGGGGGAVITVGPAKKMTGGAHSVATRP